MHCLTAFMLSLPSRYGVCIHHLSVKRALLSLSFMNFACTNWLFLDSCVTEKMIQSKMVDYKEEVESLKSGLKEARVRANIWADSHPWWPWTCYDVWEGTPPWFRHHKTVSTSSFSIKITSTNIVYTSHIRARILFPILYSFSENIDMPDIGIDFTWNLINPWWETMNYGYSTCTNTSSAYPFLLWNVSCSSEK